jgi:hypothetical protein
MTTTAKISKTQREALEFLSRDGAYVVTEHYSTSGPRWVWGDLVRPRPGRATHNTLVVLHRQGLVRDTKTGFGSTRYDITEKGRKIL